MVRLNLGTVRRACRRVVERFHAHLTRLGRSQNSEGRSFVIQACVHSRHRACFMVDTCTAGPCHKPATVSIGAGRKTWRFCARRRMMRSADVLRPSARCLRQAMNILTSFGAVLAACKRALACFEAWRPLRQHIAAAQRCTACVLLAVRCCSSCCKTAASTPGLALLRLKSCGTRKEVSSCLLCWILLSCSSRLTCGQLRAKR